MSEIIKPLNPLIFKVAAELAGVWYEIGRGQGLKSKHPNARAYAKANIEKFVPKAIEHLLQILANPSFNELAKAEIYDALIGHLNEDKKENLPDINVKKLNDIVKQYTKNKIKNEIITEQPVRQKTILDNPNYKNPNPFLQRPN